MHDTKGCLGSLIGRVRGFFSTSKRDEAMLKRGIGLVAALVVVALAPSSAVARMPRGGGGVNTPFGTLSQQEIMAAGGNPMMAAEMKQEKMMMQQ